MSFLPISLLLLLLKSWIPFTQRNLPDPSSHSECGKNKELGRWHPSALLGPGSHETPAAQSSGRTGHVESQPTLHDTGVVPERLEKRHAIQTQWEMLTKEHLSLELVLIAYLLHS